MKISSCKLLTKFLEHIGASHVFGIPGSNMELLDEIGGGEYEKDPECHFKW